MSRRFFLSYVRQGAAGGVVGVDPLRGPIGQPPRIKPQLKVSRAGAELTPINAEDGRTQDQVVAKKLTTGFKVGEHGLYVEARQVKALLKECTNILFGGERWGPTRKGPKSFLAERVFVEPDRLYLGVQQPSGLELLVGHVNGPTGPQSTLGYHEYVLEPDLEFSVLVLRDVITADQWADVWALAEQIGFGAVRSQGYGRFRVVSWRPET